MHDRVAAAAADFAAYAVGEDREAEPALIFEAVPLGRIEREPYPPEQSLGDRPKAIEARRKRAADIERAEPLVRRLERSRRLDQRQIGGGDLGHAAGVLGVEPVPQRGDQRGIERQRPGGERRDQVGQGEIDRDTGHPGRGQCLDCDADDFARGGDGVEPDQFAAQLQELALRTELGGAELEDGPA